MKRQPGYLHGFIKDLFWVGNIKVQYKDIDTECKLFLVRSFSFYIIGNSCAEET